MFTGYGVAEGRRANTEQGCRWLPVSQSELANALISAGPWAAKPPQVPQPIFGSTRSPSSRPSGTPRVSRTLQLFVWMFSCTKPKAFKLRTPAPIRPCSGPAPDLHPCSALPASHGAPTALTRTWTWTAPQSSWGHAWSAHAYRVCCCTFSRTTASPTDSGRWRGSRDKQNKAGQ